MTRKDYERIAATLRDSYWAVKCHPEMNTVTCANHIIRRIADMLALDNPRFDRARFLKACGMTGE